MSAQNTGKQVDQDPEDFASFGNEPQGGLSVKPARWPLVDLEDLMWTPDLKANGLFIILWTHNFCMCYNYKYNVYINP